MIKTKKDLKEYIKADFERQNMTHPFLASLTFGEHALTRSYLKLLRIVEYHKNNSNSLYHKIMYGINLLRHRRACIRTGLYIFPNTTQAGLFLPHPGFIRIPPYIKIGKNCTVLPMVLFGKKSPEVDGSVTVGDNCYFGVGVTVLGPLVIGNNVTVAAGAVVTKDIPDNCVVAGVPAKVVKIKEIV